MGRSKVDWEIKDLIESLLKKEVHKTEAATRKASESVFFQNSQFDTSYYLRGSRNFVLSLMSILYKIMASFA